MQGTDAWPFSLAIAARFHGRSSIFVGAGIECLGTCIESLTDGVSAWTSKKPGAWMESPEG